MILWDMKSGAIVESWTVDTVVRGLTFASENGYLAICSQCGVTFRDPNNSCITVAHIDVAYNVQHCSWSPNTAFCALIGTQSPESDIFCIGVYSMTTTETIVYHEFSMPPLREYGRPTFSHDCQRLLLTQQSYEHADPDLTAEAISWIWDIHSRTPPRKLLTHGVLVEGYMFNPTDSGQVYLIMRNGTIQVRNIASGVVLASVVLTHVNDLPYSSKILRSPNGIHIIIEYSLAKEFRLCNMKTGAVFDPLQGVDVSGFSWMVFSPDGRRILSRSQDSAAKLWDPYTGRHVLSLEAHIDWVEEASFSPDSRYIATGYTDGTVRLWKVEDGACLAILTEHTSCVHRLVFSANGEFLISIGVNGAVYIRHLHDILQVRH